MFKVESASQNEVRARKANKDGTTPVLLRHEFLGSLEELQALAHLKELATFEWKEHLLRMRLEKPGRIAAFPCILGVFGAFWASFSCFLSCFWGIFGRILP